MADIKIKRPPSPALLAGCKHPEAFCLMLYRAVIGGEEEWIWNSRDAVTPFCVRLKSGEKASHVEWHRDKFDPLHVPRIGDRIFVNLSLDRARQYRRSYVDLYWEDREYPMSGRYESREKAIEHLAAEDVKSFGLGTTPAVVEVDEWIMNDLLSRRIPNNHPLGAR